MPNETTQARPPEYGGATGSVGFRLTTLPHIDGKITQELQEYMGEQTRTLSRWVLDSREQGVRDALVQLGWTPPNARIDRQEEA
jgi:hypothetical protein